MKIVDISAFDIVKPGIEFQIQSTTPRDEGSVAELLPNMERNEGAVFWLEPKGGTVEQQEACICVNGVFYALNSKFEKAIFRNVRLTRDFKNYERLVDGKTKLVIPRRLFSEKLRTSRRNVSLMRKLDGKPPPAERPVSDPAAAPPAAALESAAPESAAPESAAPETPALPAQRPKRKKTSLDVGHTFEVVAHALKRDPKHADRQDTVPPLMHTPHSLLRLLFDSFEQEFPHRLPPEAVEHMLRALREEA